MNSTGSVLILGKNRSKPNRAHPYFGVEEMPKPRGTGTYFPNTNHFRDKPMITRGRNQALVRSPRNNSHSMTPNPENHMSERNSRDLSQVQMSHHKGGGKSVSSDSPSGSPRKKVHPHTNGSIHPSEQVVEFGSTGHAPSEAPGSGRHTNAGSSVSQNSSGSHGSPGMQWTKAELGADENRIAAQSYRLKDEDDFPPLSI